MEGTKTPVREEGQVSQASSLGSSRQSFCAYTPKTTSSKLPATCCQAQTDSQCLLQPFPLAPPSPALICWGLPSATTKLGQVYFPGVLSPCDLISLTDKCLSHTTKGSRHRAKQLQWVPQSSPLSCPLRAPVVSPLGLTALPQPVSHACPFCILCPLCSVLWSFHRHFPASHVSGPGGKLKA